MSDLLTTTTLSGFPKSFLSSLKVLFDILDDRGTGYVKLSDIAERWRDDGSVDSLPPGVTAALRKVAPPDGKLTFETFVAGLKMALLNGTNESSETELNLNDVNDKAGRKEPILTTYRAKPVSAVNLGGHKSGTSNDVPSMSKQRAFSMPQLDGKVSYPHNGQSGPGRGERTDQQHFRSTNQQATKRPPGNSNKNGGEPDLQAMHMWQKQQLQKSADQEKRRFERQSDFRKPGDGKSSTASSSALERYSGLAGDIVHAKGRGSTAAPPGGARMVKRRDSRRHTLANGVDFNMIKRMKLLERERDVLLQGLEMVERARTWYQQQLTAVQEKQHSATANNDQSLEAHQERISFQMARIFEVNQQLKALVESSEKGLPFHMNLAVGGAVRPHVDRATHATELREKDTTIGRLKSQNRMLTQEVSAISEKVTQLEQEKRQLIREMFEARAYKQMCENKKHSYDDMTFI